MGVVTGIAPDRLAAALTAVAPSAGIGVWLPALMPWMQSAGIVSDRRIAAFLGQCAEESQRFTMLSESLMYTHAERIAAVFHSHFPTAESAEPFVGKPVSLANRVYAGMLGNGPEASGDGWQFRGSGLIQITGRATWTELSTSVGRTLEDLCAWVRTPPGAAASACWFWDRHGINALADAWDIEAVTHRINPALLNLSTRIVLSETALAALAGVVAIA